MSIFEVIVLAIIEGLTEFLPVSSTGHMIIASSLMGIQSENFVKLFTVAIQLGTILSVVVLYFKRFFKSFDFYFKLLVAFIPAVIFGLLFSDTIDQLLESPLTVAISLLLGGILLLFVDKWFKNADLDDPSQISYPTAFKIGIFQCLAMIPGVSRSGASIIGGMTQKLTRKAAAEFSFFLAIPIMFAATGYDLLKNWQLLSIDDLAMFAVGFITAFVSALVAIKFLLRFVASHSFRLFAWYRIALGLLVIWYFQ